VKRFIVLAILTTILAGLVLFGLSDTVVTFADTTVPINEATISISKASNSSASATITITMYTVANE